MRKTQIEAWESIQETVSDKRFKVWNIIKDNPSTSFKVAESLGWPINRVTGRIRELCDMGMVRDSGLRTLNIKSNRNVILWEVCDEPPIHKLKCQECAGKGFVRVSVAPSQSPEKSTQ